MRKPTIRFIVYVVAAFLFISLKTVADSRPAANSSPAQRDAVRKITIFYTSDEEGYLEPTKDRVKAYGGSANVMAALRQRRARDAEPAEEPEEAEAVMPLEGQIPHTLLEQATLRDALLFALSQIMRQTP